MTEISTNYIEHIRKQIGEENIEQFLHYCQLPLRKSIRINILKISVDEFLNKVSQYNWALEPVPWCPTGFWLTRPAPEELSLPLGNTLEHLAGLFYVQEASSMLPAEALLFGVKLKNTELKILLDMAAAPGSKTTQLASLTNNKCLLIANELSGSRVKSLYASLRRCGVSNFCLSHGDGRDFGNKTPEQFDAILLDAPCGGEGTVRKDDKALKNWQAGNLEILSTLQKQLIDSAFAALKPGGILVYSTCTISSEENQQVCEHLLKNHAEICESINLESLFPNAKKAITNDGFLHVLPQYFDSEGFFVACFYKKTSHTKNTIKDFEPVKVSGNWQFINIDIQKQFEQYLQTQFKFSLENLSGELLLKNIHKVQEIWLFPENLSNTLLQSIKPKRSGLRLAEIRVKRNYLQFRLTHEFIITYGKHFSGNCFLATKQQSRDFLMGKDLSKNDIKLSSGEVLVCYDGFPLGLGKVINNRIKNNLPRELVKDKLDWSL